MPNNWGKFSYKIDVRDNKLQIIVKEELLKIFYTPDEYKILKEFYNKVIEKKDEQLVIGRV